MGQTKKHAKGRLDKFYHMAKDQGYRARSAFKLIQLNKKYDFLSNSKCLVDLCAAPGGWLQVAAKYMPKPNIIIGVDLERIKPIPGVITHVEDITSESCRTTIRRDLKTWKADVVCHDGAPNVGVSWAQDAFTQSELTLQACKLATEFLREGGVFVTKVFRSKDYFKLMWVFKQLFKQVEATKPSASRQVSAEIFVVCRGYLAPKKIDPRILDPAYAFKEQDDVNLDSDDPKKIKGMQGAILNDLMHPEKRKRHRGGYEDGDYTLFKSNSVLDFIENVDFMNILSRSSALEFGSDDKSTKIQESRYTNDDIREYLKDLKVLGKKDFKSLMKWRDQIRKELGLVKKEIEAPEKNEEEIEEDIEEVIKRQQEELSAKAKRAKKNKREQEIKMQKRMDKGMVAPMDLGDNTEIGDEKEVYFGEDISDSEDETILTPHDLKISHKKHGNSSESESDLYDTDDEMQKKIRRLDEEMDGLYKEFEQNRVERNPAKKVKQVHEMKAAFDEWYGLGKEQEPEVGEYNTHNDDSSDTDSDSELEEVETDERPLSTNAQKFFDNPLFDVVDEEDQSSSNFKGIFDEELDRIEEIESSRKRKKANNEQTFETVPESVPAEGLSEDEDGISYLIEIAIDTAEKYSIAQKLINKSGKRDLINNSFNRFAFDDPEDLPEWF